MLRERSFCSDQRKESLTTQTTVLYSMAKAYCNCWFGCSVVMSRNRTKHSYLRCVWLIRKELVHRNVLHIIPTECGEDIYRDVSSCNAHSRKEVLTQMCEDTIHQAQYPGNHDRCIVCARACVSSSIISTGRGQDQRFSLPSQW